MSQSKSPIRYVAILLGVVLCAAAFLLFRKSPKQEEPEAEVAEPEVEEPEVDEPEPAPTPAPQAPKVARAPEPAPTAAQPTPAPEPVVEPPQTVDQQQEAILQDPQLRQHANAMVLGTATEAMARGDLESLDNLVQLSNDQQLKGVVKPTDFDAIKIAKTCLEGKPEGQRDATAFLQYGPRSSLDDALRKSCWGPKPDPNAVTQPQGDTPQGEQRTQ